MTTRSARRSGTTTDVCCSPMTEIALAEGEAANVAVVFAALADPGRLRLLSIVAAEGEVCSCHLETPLGKSQPTISHHTKVLAEAGLIVGEKRGRWMWWRIVPDRMAMLRQILGGS
ncbi:MAG TPA: metalloregulator ArsR/SmtB family transcription factor [Acidimicrobiales bacterium]|nr:metalloregulator ArsR/SmtB family transcription factor [Acidimicrobiales bacterium]